jgi:hypothetical protein
MTTVNKYRIKCLTDSKFEYVWATEEPTACPVNSQHSIDQSATVIVDSVTETIQKVDIEQETVETGGNFQATTLTVPISGSDWCEQDFSWPIPISIAAAYYTTDEANRGDLLQAIAAPETIVGAVSAPVTSGQSTFTVTDTVIPNLDIGYYIELVDSNNSIVEDLGRLISVDEENSTITTENGTSQALDISPNPTYVRFSVRYIDNVEIGSPSKEVIGESNIKMSNFPANTILRLKYKRQVGSATKFIVRLEYYY